MRKYLKLNESFFQEKQAEHVIELLEKGWKIEKIIPVNRQPCPYALIIFYKANNPSKRR